MNKYKIWLEEQIVECELDWEMYKEQGADVAARNAGHRWASYKRALEAYNRMYQQDYQAAKRKKKGEEGEKKR